MKQTLLVPNGSLFEPTVALLAKIGLKLSIDGRKFATALTGSEIFNQAIIMRPQDMPEALLDDLAEAAICGYDWLAESGMSKQLAIVAKLNYSKKTDRPVRLVVFGRREALVDRKNILVTTEYPRLTAEIFKKAVIRFSHGGTEQKVAYGKYDYGVCVTETGESLRQNGLKIVKTIMVSPTVLVARRITPELRIFGELLIGALKAESYRLVKLNVENKDLAGVLRLLPALKAPTINRLVDGDFAVETVVAKTQMSDLVVALKRRGASGILVHSLDIIS